MHRHAGLAAMALAAALLGACAGTPETLRGDFPGPAPAAAGDTDRGARVRWGGRLLEVRPEARRSCLEILALPLDDRARPESGAAPGRRFLACRDGFIDPAAFPPERHVTVTGTLAGFTTRSIGEYDYRYPVVQAETIHLWPRPPEPRPYGPWGYDPWYPHYRDPWGPRPPYWW